MQILTNKSLLDYNTFHLDVQARYFVEVSSVDDVQALLHDPIFPLHKKLIIGGGSNILLTEDVFDGLVILNTIIGKNIISDNGVSVVLSVGAGENWHDFVMRAVENNWGGIENLALIPGSVGAAPVQNIGAYGVEAKDVIESVEYIDFADGSLHVLSQQECQFGYRDSIFKRALKDRVMITSVVFRLQQIPRPNPSVPKVFGPPPLIRGDEEGLREVERKHHYTLKLEYKDIQRVIVERKIDPATLSVKDVAMMIADIRRGKMPDWTKVGTAGSFFKNPIISVSAFQRFNVTAPEIQGYPVDGGVKLSAGQLIELAGLKGIERGKVGTYQNHALILVHHGGGTGKDIISLVSYIQDTVFAKFGVRLEPEVNYV